jgi:hypothetical protein
MIGLVLFVDRHLSFSLQVKPKFENCALRGLTVRGLTLVHEKEFLPALSA